MTDDTARLAALNEIKALCIMQTLYHAEIAEDSSYHEGAEDALNEMIGVIDALIEKELKP